MDSQIIISPYSDETPFYKELLIDREILKMKTYKRMIQKLIS